MIKWTDASIEKHILSKLGYPYRKIELDNTNITEALKSALAKYGSKKPRIKNDRISINQGQQAYDFTALNKPYGSGILEVNPEPLYAPQGPYNEFNVQYNRFMGVYPYEIGDITMETMYAHEIQNVTGAAWDWEWDEASTKLLITPIPSRSHFASYQYNDPPSLITEVHYPDQIWCVEYALAVAKEMLGRVRNKYQGVPGNDLPVQTDGSDLLQEGLEAQEALETKLDESIGDWTPAIIG